MKYQALSDLHLDLVQHKVCFMQSNFIFPKRFFRFGRHSRLCVDTSSIRKSEIKLESSGSKISSFRFGYLGLRRWSSRPQRDYLAIVEFSMSPKIWSIWSRMNKKRYVWIGMRIIRDTILVCILVEIYAIFSFATDMPYGIPLQPTVEWEKILWVIWVFLRSGKDLPII